ncbi:MAG: hypothetical protein COC01_03020 [Bacteroidetes bacterium]|nr:DUF2007 domain-containing protein [Bacteroidia bacterium]PCH68723.1 MAG: hypothetical protein COC01_03020 [Bacteroidota bacterium]
MIPGKDWVKVFSSNQQFQVELMKGVLENNGIDSVVINKQDSLYMNFGEVELYTLKSFGEKAVQLITMQKI